MLRIHAASESTKEILFSSALHLLSKSSLHLPNLYFTRVTFIYTHKDGRNFIPRLHFKDIILTELVLNCIWVCLSRL